MLSPSFTACVALNKLFNLSDVQFNHLYKETLVKLADLKGGLKNIFM